MIEIFKNVPRILFGRGTFSRIGELIHSYNKKVLVVVDDKISSIDIKKNIRNIVDIIPFSVK